MGRLLYDLQEELGEEAANSGCRLRTGVVYGDGAVKVRDFFEYHPAFRFQYISDPAEYSAGESMIIASELIKKEQELAGKARKESGKEDRKDKRTKEKLRHTRKSTSPFDNGGLLRYNHRCTRVGHRVIGSNLWQQ